MRRWLSGAVTCGMLMLSEATLPEFALAEISYRQPTPPLSVAGRWTVQPDDTYQVARSVQTLDIDGDQRFEFELGHGYRRPLAYVPQSAADLAGMAGLGLENVELRLQEIRQLAVLSANAGLNDEDDFLANQLAVAAHLEWLERFGERWTYHGQRLLSGDLSIHGQSQDASVLRVNRTDQTTKPGTYEVQISEPAQRAVVVLPEAQTTRLAMDETITINAVNIELAAGMPQQEVIDRINEATPRTQVAADYYDGRTRLYSLKYGDDAFLATISNRPASGSSSGVGTIAHHAYGRSPVLTIDGVEFTGKSLMTQITHGPAKGLTLTMVPDPFDPTSVATAPAVRVDVIDSTPRFPLLPEAVNLGEVSVPLANVHATALGTGVSHNSFSSLAEITVTDSHVAQDAIAILDAAIDEIQKERQKIELLLEIYHRPHGFAEFQALGTAGFAVNDGQLVELVEGDLVGEGRIFSQSMITYDAEIVDGVLRDDQVSKFFGFRFLQAEQPHYGWMRVRLDADNQLTLLDYAYERQPNRSIRAGFVPEPSNVALVGTAAMSLVCRLIRRRANRTR